MDSVPHLLAADRRVFERVLDQALREAASSPATTKVHLNTEQLRTLALDSMAAISARAAVEYDHYLRAREQRAAQSAAPRAAGSTGHVSPSGGIADASRGAGVFPTAAVLIPVLAVPAALIFLLVGYILAAIDPQATIASPLRTAGWVFLTVAAAGILTGMAGILRTALHNGSRAVHASHAEEPADVVAAREAWHSALLERGMLPFLRNALSGDTVPGAVPEGAAKDGRQYSRTPPTLERPGYPHPDFAGPGDRKPASGSPQFSGPGFSSPDVTGPDTVGSDPESHESGRG